MCKILVLFTQTDKSESMETKKKLSIGINFLILKVRVSSVFLNNVEQQIGFFLTFT